MSQSSLPTGILSRRIFINCFRHVFFYIIKILKWFKIWLKYLTMISGSEEEDSFPLKINRKWNLTRWYSLAFCVQYRINNPGRFLKQKRSATSAATAAPERSCWTHSGKVQKRARYITCILAHTTCNINLEKLTKLESLTYWKQQQNFHLFFLPSLAASHNINHTGRLGFFHNATYRFFLSIEQTKTWESWKITRKRERERVFFYPGCFFGLLPDDSNPLFFWILLPSSFLLFPSLFSFSSLCRWLSHSGHKFRTQLGAVSSGGGGGGSQQPGGNNGRGRSLSRSETAGSSGSGLHLQQPEHHHRSSYYGGSVDRSGGGGDLERSVYSERDRGYLSDMSSRWDSCLYISLALSDF